MNTECPAGGICPQSETCDTRGCLQFDPPLIGGGSQRTEPMVGAVFQETLAIEALGRGCAPADSPCLVGACSEVLRVQPSPDIAGCVAVAIDDSGDFVMALLSPGTARALAYRLLATADAVEVGHV